MYVSIRNNHITKRKLFLFFVKHDLFIAFCPRLPITFLRSVLPHHIAESVTSLPRTTVSYFQNGI